MSFLLKTNVKYRYNLKPVNGLMNINTDYANKKNTNSHIIICDRDIYKMDYNMNTIKKRVPHLFINPSKNCYYFYSVGITNLRLTTYNDFMHDQAKLLFNVMNVYETAGKLRYSVFAGNSVGLVRAGRNLPWGDDYDLILFKNDIAFFSKIVLPELERFGFMIKTKILNGIVCGVKIFGPPIMFNDAVRYHNVSIFQCDVFYSYFDGNNILKNCGGWGLYHEKNIPHSVVFPLKKRMFHGILLPFFNNPFEEVAMCYGNISKCSIFSHHIGSTIFYSKWEHAYKDFCHIKKKSISNTKKYIVGSGKGGQYTPCNTLILTRLLISETVELRNILLVNNDSSYILKKLHFLCYLYKNNIGVIIVPPLSSFQNCTTSFKTADLKKENRKLDMVDYDHNVVGLKFIGEHIADIKIYFSKIKIIYDETVENDSSFSSSCFLSPLFYNYVDIIRTTRDRYENIYQTQFTNAMKYKFKTPGLEIIDVCGGDTLEVNSAENVGSVEENVVGNVEENVGNVEESVEENVGNVEEGNVEENVEENVGSVEENVEEIIGNVEEIIGNVEENVGSVEENV